MIERFKQPHGGALVILRMRFTRSGVLVDPFGILSVEIKNGSGAIVSTIAKEKITKDSSGNYSVQYLVPVDAVLGSFYRDVWTVTFEEEGLPVEVEGSFFIFSGFVGTPGGPYASMPAPRLYDYILEPNYATLESKMRVYVTLFSPFAQSVSVDVVNINFSKGTGSEEQEHSYSMDIESNALFSYLIDFSLWELGEYNVVITLIIGEETIFLRKSFFNVLE